jgi:multidrug efflux pump subunit AcrA (membrane-fusion protein)
MTDGKAKRNSIVSGIENNTHVEIISGIRSGDSVIVSGLEGLKDGAVVRVSNPDKGSQSLSEKDKDN